MNQYEPYISLLEKALKELDDWRDSFGDHSGAAEDGTGSGISADMKDPGGRDTLEKLLHDYTSKLKENYPFHHPAYAGQMLKPPHPAAWLAHTLAMTINPNNHSSDSGPATSRMENEIMEQMSGLVGYREPSLGHLTTGGTIANVEALWISRELHPGKAIASTSNAHYTHSRMCKVIKASHMIIPVDGRGNPDMKFLRENAGDIGTIVVTIGTTGLGQAEPLDELIPWARKHGIRVHADAAYGGFYKLLAGSEGIDSGPWDILHEADSIVIDPHKHGLQPYGCGSILFKDPAVGHFYRHDSPYTYFTSSDLHLGEISLECSRAGAAAAAFWLTLKLLPLTSDGLGSILRACRTAALSLSAKLKQSENYRLYIEPELDIVTYFPRTIRKRTSEVSSASEDILNAGMTDKDHPLWLSLCKIPSKHFTELHPDYEADTDKVEILRSVLMKPGHEPFTTMISDRLEAIFRKVMQSKTSAADRL